jgi:cholesterol transport system auxiliary component
MLRILFCCLVVLLTGCVGNPPRAVDVLRHDLGDPPEREAQREVVISRVEVRAARWLDTPALQYRLVYRDPLTRRSYADNRWIAAPGELLERWLERHLLSGQSDSVGSGCRLVLQLDELEQRFTTPQSSELVLAVHASLYPTRGETLLSGKSFKLVQAAPAPDARGGVQATRDGVATLARELARWFAEIRRTRPSVLAPCN